MNYLKTLKGAVFGDDSAEKISRIIPVSDQEFQCNPSECHIQFKESAFQLKGSDATVPLYETASPADLHILVSTGKTDWPHDAFDEKNTILPLIRRHSQSLGKKYVAANVTNEPLDISDPDCLSLKKLDVLLLPWFVWIKGITETNIKQVFSNIEVVLNDESENVKGKQAEILIAKLKSIPGISCYKDINSSYILLCSHRTRDKRCGITAPIMKKEFDSQLRDLDLYRDSGDDRSNGVHVMFVNHVGGHKFAANVLIYNKHGEFIWFARCTPLNVKFIINETVLHNKADVKHVRTCIKFDAIKW
ncbi:hypothetical protein CANINC_004508 [Pichia inconspicua]|uniref:Actin patches distal protein 1 n=1 Tax=Pichia inconspicua TaxID=52247 RepID=A0A4T0WVH6_9ASCO|nr:hypothetical protein CANINC_004508 [[Candida] inconspicua]